MDRQYSQLVVDRVIRAPFIEGARELIEAANARDKDCFVISATPQEEIRWIVKERRMEHLFKDVVGSPKSKKDNLSFLTEEYGLKAAESIFFGDAQADYEAAKDHGIQFVGIVDKSRELEKVLNITKIKNFSHIFTLD